MKSLPPALARPTASTSPRWISTRWRTSARPMPRPPWERSTERSSCTKSSNTRLRIAGAMPSPLSRTCTTARSPSRSIEMEISPPSSVYLAALVSRFSNTWVRRMASPSTHSGCGGSFVSKRCRLRSSSGRTVSIARAIVKARSTGSMRSPIAPRVMREMSSRSSTSRVTWSTWRTRVSRTQATRASVPPMRLSTSAALRIGASGLRSSWPSMARNSSLRRSASRRASSASRWLWMSIMQPTWPLAESRVRGIITSFIQRGTPPSTSTRAASSMRPPGPARIDCCTRADSSGCSSSVQRRPCSTAADWPSTVAHSRFANSMRPSSLVVQISTGALSARVRKRRSLAASSACARLLRVMSRSIRATAVAAPASSRTTERLVETSITSPLRVRRLLSAPSTSRPAITLRISSS